MKKTLKKEVSTIKFKGKPEESIKILEKESSPVIAKSKKIEIANAQDMEKAAEILSNLNRYADQVKKEKDAIVKPINEGLKRIRQLFAPLEERLEDSINMIRVEMSQYQTLQKRNAEEEAAKIAARIGEGKGKLSVETAVNKIEEIETPADRVSTDSGMVKFKTVKKFQVTDVSLIPKEFILPNEVEIRKAMIAGIEIAGVRYFEEEVPVNFR